MRVNHRDVNCLKKRRHEGLSASNTKRESWKLAVSAMLIMEPRAGSKRESSSVFTVARGPNKRKRDYIERRT